MNKDIVDKVHGVLGSTKADAERAVETVIESIVGGLKSGDEVSIAGLGIFATKARPAREGRNPAPARPSASQPAARRVPPAKALKDAVSKPHVRRKRSGAPGAPLLSFEVFRFLQFVRQVGFSSYFS